MFVNVEFYHNTNPFQYVGGLRRPNNKLIGWVRPRGEVGEDLMKEVAKEIYEGWNNIVGSAGEKELSALWINDTMLTGVEFGALLPRVSNHIQFNHMQGNQKCETLVASMHVHVHINCWMLLMQLHTYSLSRPLRTKPGSRSIKLSSRIGQGRATNCSSRPFRGISLTGHHRNYNSLYSSILIASTFKPSNSHPYTAATGNSNSTT